MTGTVSRVTKLTGWMFMLSIVAVIGFWMDVILGLRVWMVVGVWTGDNGFLTTTPSLIVGPLLCIIDRVNPLFVVNGVGETILCSIKDAGAGVITSGSVVITGAWTIGEEAINDMGACATGS